MFTSITSIVMDEEPYQSSSSSGSQGDLSSEASTVEAGEAETPKSECRDNFGDIVVHDGFQTLRPAFRKTHRREESRVSKISRVSIRSLNGDVVDGVSESGPEFKSPVIRFLVRKMDFIWPYLSDSEWSWNDFNIGSFTVAYPNGAINFHYENYYPHSGGSTKNWNGDRLLCTNRGLKI